MAAHFSLRAVDQSQFEKVFSELITQATKRLRTDPQRVHVVGYSQGGTAAVTLAVDFIGLAGAVIEEVLKSPAESSRPIGSQLFMDHSIRTHSCLGKPCKSASRSFSPSAWTCPIATIRFPMLFRRRRAGT